VVEFGERVLSKASAVGGVISWDSFQEESRIIAPNTCRFLAADQPECAPAHFSSSVVPERGKPSVGRRELAPPDPSVRANGAEMFCGDGFSEALQVPEHYRPE